MIAANSTEMVKISNIRSKRAFFLCELLRSLPEIFSKNTIITICIQ